MGNALPFSGGLVVGLAIVALARHLIKPQVAFPTGLASVAIEILLMAVVVTGAFLVVARIAGASAAPRRAFLRGLLCPMLASLFAWLLSEMVFGSAGGISMLFAPTLLLLGAVSGLGMRLDSNPRDAG